jgi:hypothetical protein
MTGTYGFGFDPNDHIFTFPGLAMEFRTGSVSAPLESIRVSLNLYAGQNEMVIALHEAEPYVDGAQVMTIRPGPIIESFHLTGVLTATTQVVTVESLLQPLLRQDTSYFVSVVAIGNGERQLLRWSEGADCEAGFLSEECLVRGSVGAGFVRAYLSSSGSWGTYLYTSFPRTAFEVTAVPEPSAVTLCASGLVALAFLSRRLTRRRGC